MFNLDRAKGQRLLGSMIVTGDHPPVCQRLSLRFEDDLFTFSARVGSDCEPYIVMECCTPFEGVCPCCKQYFTTTSVAYSAEKPFDGRCPSCRNYEQRMVS